MTTIAFPLPTARTWEQLRAAPFQHEAPAIIAAAAPEGLIIDTVAHLRTAHYSVYKVTALDGSCWVTRIGVVGDTDDAPAENTGFLGTSAASPSGQSREVMIARGYASAGANVSVPVHYARAGNLDVSWVPFLTGTDAPVTAAQWHAALSALHAFRPAEDFPVFTNRAKSFARLEEVPDTLAIGLRNQYDTCLESLFEAATTWSVIHGDAHAGNAINCGGSAVLFDFDTACMAPSVWDLTHLLNRAGAGENTGYTAPELAGLFNFTAAEVDAALRLRQVAALIAKTHREFGAAQPVLLGAAA